MLKEMKEDGLELMLIINLEYVIHIKLLYGNLL
jgi:hypothetical protein